MHLSRVTRGVLCGHRVALLVVLVSAVAAPEAGAQRDAAGASQATALTVGETFTIQSKVMGEARRINIYRPPVSGESPDARRPVFYMPDGGMPEDFLHIAGLLQVMVGNGTMRPFLLVGIENTQRRRDLSGPTESAEDRKMAPVVGASATFRRFIRSELMPVIKARYQTTAETAIMAESLAGLFVVETLFLEPDLFDTYIAFDPSLWWNNNGLLKVAAERARAIGTRPWTLYLASSSQDFANLTTELAGVLAKTAPANLTWHYEPMPNETHATIYHPAAVRALRTLFKPAPARSRVRGTDEGALSASEETHRTRRADRLANSAIGRPTPIA